MGVLDKVVDNEVLAGDLGFGVVADAASPSNGAHTSSARSRESLGSTERLINTFGQDEVINGITGSKAMHCGNSETELGKDDFEK